MPRFDCFIFDIDGTMVDSGRLIFESFRYVAQKYLNRSYSDEEIIGFFGPTEEYILRKLMGEKFPDAEKDYFEFYSSQHNRMAALHPGITEALELIKSKDIPLAVFTGKGRRSALITLEQTDTLKYFDFIVSGDEVNNHKPHHEGLELIIEKYGVDRSRTILIGDTSHDANAAKAAEIKCGIVLWDDYAKDKSRHLGVDYTFSNKIEFANFVAEVTDC